MACGFRRSIACQVLLRAASPQDPGLEGAARAGSTSSLSCEGEQSEKTLGSTGCSVSSHLRFSCFNLDGMSVGP